MKIVLSSRAYLQILSETAEKADTETGGILLGCVEEDVFYVIEAIDPGPNSIFQPAYFEYDQPYTEHLINKVARLYQHRLYLVGLWHRHPGSLDVFSATDGETNRKYAGLHRHGALSFLVNVDPTFRLTAYHVQQPLTYTRVFFEVSDELIPESIRAMKDHAALEDRIRVGARLQAGPSKINLFQDLFARMASFLQPYLLPLDSEKKTGPENEDSQAEAQGQLSEAIVQDLVYLSETHGISMKIIPEGDGFTVHPKDERDALSFFHDTAGHQIVFSYRHQNHLYSEGLFESLLESQTPPGIRAEAQAGD